MNVDLKTSCNTLKSDKKPRKTRPEKHLTQHKSWNGTRSTYPPNPTHPRTLNRKSEFFTPQTCPPTPNTPIGTVQNPFPLQTYETPSLVGIPNHTFSRLLNISHREIFIETSKGKTGKNTQPFQIVCTFPETHFIYYSAQILAKAKLIITGISYKPLFHCKAMRP